MKKNGFAPLILILVVVILSVAGYFTYTNFLSKPTTSPLSKNTLDISTWETYTDKTNFYSIKYPKGWYVTNSSSNEVGFASFTEDQLTNQERKDVLGGLKTDVISIKLGVYEGTVEKGTSLLSWLKNNDQYVSAMSGAPTSEKETTIAGNPGLILNYAGTGPFYVFSAGSHVFYAFYSPADSKLAGIFDQMISTFILTSDSLATPIVTDTSNWEIYQNTTPAFSFKYPADFVNKAGAGNKAVLSVGNDKYSLLLYINYMQSFYTSETVSIKENFDSKDLSADVKNLGLYTAYLKSEQSAGGDYSFSRTVIIPMQKDVVVFILSPKDENKFSETENLANQILSTFKFTK